MQFRVLGPLEVEIDGRPVPIPAAKLRVLLAALLLQANRPVSIAELAEKLWGHAPPVSARSVVQKYAMRLRKTLSEGAHIVTEPDGYRIEVPPGSLDLDQFRELVQAAATSGEPKAESACLAEALAIWTAVPPLANVASDALHRAEVPELVERYLRAAEQRIDADLSLNRHRELVAELMQLVRSHPLRERFWAQLMRALHGSGRQADALATYREVTRLLADELGIDPGEELRAAQREILQGAESPTAAPTYQFPRPAQLPIAAAAFVGREPEIAKIVSQLTDLDDGATTPVVVVSGPAGVGKTTLAVHAAHAVADRFPDGQLFADLRSHSGTPGPRQEAVLSQFLSALGLAQPAVPVRLPDQIPAFRSLLAGRRVLIVLDDAQAVDQVRDLLPGSAGCAVLVTSRNEFAGLAVNPGAHRIGLGMLTPTESHRLLREIIGGGRADEDAPAAAELVALCSGLALALRVAAAHLIQRPELGLRDYVDQLRAQDPVTALRIEGDDSTSLSVALDWSYRLLPPQRQRLLRLLSLVPGPDVTPPAVAALLGTTEQDAAAGLEQLAGASLLFRLPGQRYRPHDLVRGYAALRCRSHDSPSHRDQARRSLFDHYIRTVDAAVQPMIVLSKLPRDAPPPSALEPEAALSALDENRASLVAAVRDAAEHGPADAAYHLADALRGYFTLRGHAVDWGTVADAGLTAARQTGSDEAVAAMLNSRGAMGYHNGDTARAAEDFTAALEIYQRLGSPAANAARINLGIIAQVRDDLPSAVAYLDSALAGYRQLGDRDMETRARENLVLALLEFGDLAHATRECLALADAAAQPHGYRARGAIGMLAARTGKLQLAVDVLSDAATRAAERGDDRTEVGLLDEVARCFLAMGRDDDAHRLAQQTRDRAETVDLRNAPNTEATIAEVLFRIGRTEEAGEHFRRALRQSREAANRDQECAALIGWAELDLALGRVESARRRAGEAERLARASMRRLRLVQVLVVLARCHRHDGASDLGSAAAQEALLLARESSYPLGQATAQAELAELAELAQTRARR